MSVLNYLKSLATQKEEKPLTREVLIKGVKYIAHELTCAECSSPMMLRPSKFGLFYGCTEFPRCRGTHGAHPDGSPLGKPADPETKQERNRAHKRFDILWKRGWMTRPEAYTWMQQAMKLSEDEAHIGKFDKLQCRELITLVNRYIKDVDGEKVENRTKARKGKKARAAAKRRKIRLQEMHHDEMIALHNEVHNKD